MNKYHIRFLYGKLFNKLFQYFSNGINDRIEDISRFILNKNNDEDIIIDKTAFYPIKNYLNYFNDFNKECFDNIFKYLTSLFKINNTSLQQHYESMLIKEENKHKGIFFYECEEEKSIYKFIYELFLQKLGQNPIAQNILSINKETSIEEIQAFLYRAILCNYNTLFVIGINESLNYYQQSKIYDFLYKLLMHKNKKSNRYSNAKIEYTREYLGSCIVFIYEKKYKDILLLYQIRRIVEYQDISLENEFDDENKIYNKKNIDISNITVFTSDVCGLGKTFTIKNLIKEKNQKYFYLSIGGMITKKIISKKLNILLKKIGKNTNGENKIKNAIHLDLIESEEINIINEFLFSFLITKFYISNETIIYIPKNIEIYIEIPNCFKDYLSQFDILNIFPRQNISLNQISKLNLSPNIIDIFSKKILLNTNKEIEEKFIKKYLNKSFKYSYYQIMIFIKLFVTHMGFGNKRLIFYETKKNKEGKIIEKKDLTEKNIRRFAESIKYFVGGFQELLMKKINDKELEKNGKDYIDLLFEEYDKYSKDILFDKLLIFCIRETMKVYALQFPTIKPGEYRKPEYYLLMLKEALNLYNDVEKNLEKNNETFMSLLDILKYKTDNYIITNDNFKKMVLIIYRIIADIPVILMGETGCGKTLLIKKLSQILNNGKIEIEIINIHSDITDEYICQRMREINEKAKKYEKELWIFFDEINTCKSMSLLTEIFTHKTCNEEKLNDNIRLIGACLPYRRIKKVLKDMDI